MKRPAIYIVASERNATLYVGVTSDLVTRAAQHDDMTAAISREKQIKAGSRATKIRLIESVNPSWRDLFDDIV